MTPRILLLFLFGLTCSQVLAEQVSEAIIGGEYAVKGQFKYQVSVQFGRCWKKRHCGGAIISEHYILTAAHCVTEKSSNIKSQPYKVIAGTHDLHNVKHAITAHVETVYIHKHYDPNTDHHDIAILKLKHGLDLSHHHEITAKIDLPKSNQNLVGMEAVIAGFGLQTKKVEKKADQWVELGGNSDGKLKFAHAKVFSHQRCVGVYSPEIIHEPLFCAQVIQRNIHPYEGVCDGDSGSPLVRGNEVIGILSASPFACNESTMPAKYTRVGSYLNEINNIINGKQENEFKHANVPH